ncbi:Cytochrome P450 86A1 [Rhizoctonia solani]|uniref:Cytochrome P450 86A1 n=1 Tax=Rhizoctonia solani TaxID=456999 RepID=A0A0K6FKA8_9AGAM|nr:Cytochrome P450 86A1 [Rhizoctonia solani]
MSGTAYSIVAAVLTALVLFVRFAYRWLSPKPIPGIPHDPITSIWGDIPAIAEATSDGWTTFSDYVAKVVAKHGSLLQILIGRNPIVVISDRKEMERLLLGGKCTDQSKRTNEIFATVVPTGQIALPTNETWKRHRRLTGPSMSRRYLERMSGRIAAGANDLVRLWKAKSEIVGSGAFDAELDLQLATMDAIVNITLGTLLGCIEAAYNALPTRLFRSSGVVHLPHSPLHSLYSIARSRERESILGNKIGGLATDADCVLDMIIQREAREGAEAFGKGEMLDELLTYIFAGQDTTAASLAWLVKFLPKDSEIQHRLHDELCSVFGPEMDLDQPLDFNLMDDHERLPVLEAVVAETLRCAGVGSLTGRELIQDEIILGRFVPKGTQLMFTTALMSSSHSEWGPDAEQWRPTRWLTPDGAFDRLAGPSIPFGLGQRSCFGQRLAVLQIKTFVATMSRVFFFKPVPLEVDTWRAIELVTRQPKLCYVSLERWDLKQ